jgi:multiple sugar transport system permease protein
MSASNATVAPTRVAPQNRARPTGRVTRDRGGPTWYHTLIAVVIALFVMIPIFATVYLSFVPQSQSTTKALFTFENFTHIFTQTQVVLWLTNSLIVVIATVVVAVAVAAPAGYVLSRGRSKAVSSYSLILFVAQSLPIIVSVVPLFVLFAKLGLTDSLVGVTIVYVASSMSVATWMMAAYFDSIPIALEEAAWMDGASMFGGFLRIVLRNSLPGVLSTAIFAFLVAWNDYLVASVFLHNYANYTLPVGLETFFATNNTSWGYVMAVSVVMLLPPVIIFSVLNRYFSVGGIGGSLAGR